MSNTGFVKLLRTLYPIGSRIICDYCADPYNPLEPGAAGVVTFIDDLGTIHVHWDNGRSLGLIPNEDTFHMEGY